MAVPAVAVNPSATYRSLISAGCVYKALSSIPRRDHLDMEELKWPSVVLGLEVRAGWAEDDHEKGGSAQK